MHEYKFPRIYNECAWCKLAIQATIVGEIGAQLETNQDISIEITCNKNDPFGIYRTVNASGQFSSKNEELKILQSSVIGECPAVVKKTI